MLLGVTAGAEQEVKTKSDENAKINGGEESVDYELHEVLVIADTHAVGDPRTVMIHLFTYDNQISKNS